MTAKSEILGMAISLAVAALLALAALLPVPKAAQAQSDAPTVTGVEVTSSPASDDTYLLGETISVTLTFSETVDVTGTPRLKIDMDPADWGTKLASYASGSGSSSLTFTHTVVEPNYSTQGIAVLANTLQLNGGSIRSAASQTGVDLSHVGRAHDANHKVDWRRSPSAPAVAEVAVTSNAGDDDTYLLGETIRITVTFSEAVNVTGSPQLAIDMDPAEWGTKWASYDSGSGTDNLTFTHTVVEPNLSTQGIAVLENTLELNGGSIKSSSSQTDADLAHAGLAHNPSHKVDWRRSQPNRAPVVNAGTWNYQRFIGNNNAPRGVLVSKSFYQVFTDPDGDELTYSVSIPDHHRQLLDEFSIGLDYRTPENSHRSLEVFHRVWFRAEDDTDWKAVSPALADPVVVTATVTATDPEGLSVSLEGDFLIWWESHPEVVRAVGSEQAIVLTFDVAVEDDPAPTPGQFMVNVANGDGSTTTVEVTGVSVSGAVLTLGLATELASRQAVTLDYAHDDDTPLQRDGGGGDPAPDFSGQAVATLPGAVSNLEVIAEPGRKALLTTWDALDGATSYKLRWRQSGGEFEANNAANISGAIWSITVSDYGQWEVRVQGCNDAGCGPEAVQSAQAVQAASLRLERAVDAEGNVRPRTLTASWDAVEDASSYTLRWQRLGAAPQAQEPAQPAAAARQARSATNSPAQDRPASADRLASGDGAQKANAQANNQLTFSADQTGADITVPDDGAYRAELQALGDDNELIALASTNINQAPGQPDTTPPWLDYGEMDGTTITLWFNEPLDETAVGGHFWTQVNTTWSGLQQGRTSHMEISGNKVTVRGNPRVIAVSNPYGYTAQVAYHPPSAPGVRGLRDLADNPVRYFGTYIENVTGPPYVTDLAISSDPGDDGSYASGDAITVRVAFRKAVNVSGTPRLKIDLDPADGGEQWADYASGSGNRLLYFTYTVVAADLSIAGVAVLENTLEINGGAIQGAPPGPPDNARLAHGDLRHDSNHKVVTPDNAAPILQSASVTGTTLTLTFSEALGAAASLANGAFTMKKTPADGAEQEVSLSGSPAISGATVTLTLASAVLATDAGVKVSYAKPTTGMNNKLVDAGGTEVADFTNEPVVSTLDKTQPRLVRGEIDGDVMTIYFSEALDEDSVSVNAGDFFRVNLDYRSSWPQDGQCPSPTMIFTPKPREVYVSGNTLVVVGLSNYERTRANVVWTLTNFLYIADVAVTKRLRDLSGNPVSTPTYIVGNKWGAGWMQLENVTRLPWPKSATVVGKQLTLTFSSPMDRDTVPAADAFTVKMNGSQVSLDSANPVSVSGRQVTLTLAAAVASGDAVTVSYAKPESRPIQSVVCDDAPSFTDQPVTNSTP